MIVSRAGRWAVGLTGGVMAAWWAGVTWGVPLLIRAAHAGRLPLADRLLPGRATRPVEGYLEVWEPIARGSVVLAWTTAVLLLGAWLVRRHARWYSPPSVPGADPAPSTGNLLLVALWLGLLTGLGEAWYYLSREFYRGIEAAGAWGISQHAVWMSPLANAVGFGLAGGLVALYLRARGTRAEGRSAIGVLVGLSCFSLAMVTGRLHWVAAGVLALGVAVQVRRGLSPGGGQVVALARRTTPWLAVAVLGLGLLVPAGETWRERRQLGKAGVPSPDQPNVLFIVLDTQRAASTSLHGATRPTTPFLDQLAQEGVWFERAMAPASWTLPTHAAMFTGQELGPLGVDWHHPLTDRHPVLAEALARRGYATVGFVANTKYLSDVFGLGRGFGVWRDQPLLPGTIITHSWLARSVVESLRRRLGIHQLLRRKSADMVNDEFLRWVDRRPDRPFFAFLNYYDPHMPYLPPAPWGTRFANPQPFYWIDGNRADSTYSAAEKAELLAAYESSIAYLDNRLGHLFTILADRGLLERTLVVITSDHGEAFGEHGTFEHGFDMTMTLTHVPLVMRLPGAIPAGSRVADPVTLRNVAATILDLTVGEDPAIAGESLARHWRTPADSAAREVVFSTDGLISSQVTDSFQLLRVRGREDRLFNHRRDPLGLHDLAGDPAQAETLAELQRLLQARLDARP